MNLWKLLRTIRAYAGGAPLGDVAVMKIDALNHPPGEVIAKLEPVRGAEPTHDLRALRKLPPGTLGHEYARFCVKNGIHPLVVSEAVKARYHDDPYALRYTATHDLHHVLAGFDTTLAGEVGVLAFNVGQGAAPVRPWLLGLVRVLFSIVAPWQARAVGRNVREGLAMGRAADLVMAAPLESYFEEPIDDVRRRLRIPSSSR